LHVNEIITQAWECSHSSGYANVIQCYIDFVCRDPIRGADFLVVDFLCDPLAYKSGLNRDSSGRLTALKRRRNVESIA